MLQQRAGHMDKSYCAFAPGAAEPVLGLLKYFMDEIQEHLSQKKCPLGADQPRRTLWYPAV
jgi:NADH-quinone oxidoreductase subunit F